MENAFNYVVNNLINLNLESISTQETVSDSNTLLTNANQELSHMWTSCSESNPTDPGYGAYYWLMKVTGGQVPSTQPTPQQLPSQGFSDPTTMSEWLNEFIGNSNYSVSNLSSTFMTNVYNAYEQYEQKQTANGGGGKTAQEQLGLISNVTNLLQAKSQAELQTGQNGITLLNNLAQHFESDQGPLSSATSSIIDGANSYSSALSQISA